MTNFLKKPLSFKDKIKSLLWDEAKPYLLEEFLRDLYSNISETERKRYERCLINLHQEKDILETTREEGRKEVVKNMLINGMPVEQVARYTGLSIRRCCIIKGLTINCLKRLKTINCRYIS